MDQDVAQHVAAASGASVDEAAVRSVVQNSAEDLASSGDTLKLNDLIDLAISKGVSDIHFGSERKVTLRMHGVLINLDSVDELSSEKATEMIKEMLSEEEYKRFEEELELDFGYLHDDGTSLRGNAYYARGHAYCVLRIVPSQIKRIDEIGLPEVAHELVKAESGLIIVTGPTGSGKSTTMAAMIEEINATQIKHIVTIEEPIEFVFKPLKSIFSQREIGNDTTSYANALRSSLREDPNIVVISEMRDLETMNAALTLAETGHLVFATMHTSSARATVSRFVSTFPLEQHGQVLDRFSNALSAVITQRLLTKKGDNVLIPAFEVLLNNDAVKNIIQKDELVQIDNAIQVGMNQGMLSMERYLLGMVTDGLVAPEDAKAVAPTSELFDDFLQ